MQELLLEILEGTLDPGRVFDVTVDFDGVPEGYRLIANRKAIKILVKP
ncbi:hypothetical protein AB9M62_01740 [Bacillales bacterium AN1005]